MQERSKVLEDRDRQCAPLATRCELVSCSVSFREESARMRVGRGPEYRHIIYLLYSGEEGVDTSDNSFVCHWFDGPRGN